MTGPLRLDRTRERPGTFRTPRAALGAVVAVVSLAACTGALLTARDGLELPSIVLLYLVPVLLTAVAGGPWPALGSAVAADLLVNWFFVPPYHTLAVDTGNNIVSLVVYLLVAAAAGLAVDLAAAARARQTRRLAAQSARAEELAQIDRLRSALLGAVGHDLRTPLAGIKVAVSSLRQLDVEFSPEDRAELLATVEESTDRLATVVDNLLAVSRLQAGVLSVELRPTAVDAVAAQAVLAIDTGGVPVSVDVPDDLPLAQADAGLLERALANLVANACAASPPGATVTVRGTEDGTAATDGGPAKSGNPTRTGGPATGGNPATSGGPGKSGGPATGSGPATGGGTDVGTTDGAATPRRILLAVVDHGPGIPDGARDAVFAPFQRLDDHTGGGLGLGLAVARGFTEAQGGSLTPTETPGGGLTMTISLPAAAPRTGSPRPREEARP